MATYLEIQGDPDEVMSSGAKMQALADEFNGKVSGIKGEIEGIEGSAPWGDDEVGAQLLARYNQVPQGGDTPMVEELKTAMGDAGQHLNTIGQGVVVAMSEYKGTDEVSKGSISALGPTKA
jgi:hypothetical protein